MSARGGAFAALTALLVAGGGVLAAGCSDAPVGPPGGGALWSVEEQGKAAIRASAPGFVVAEVKGPSIIVHGRPDASAKALSLSNPNEVGAPRVFLALSQRGEWLRVLLPIRPNATSGWIRTGEVTLKSNPYRIQVKLGDHRLSVWKGRELIVDEPAGLGRAATATPRGTYYLTELLQPPQRNSPYGPYAFGTSAFSEVLTDFAGGEGVIGIHGTNDPASVGKDVSHGCIRLQNDVITRLAGLLPLGTPVFIAP